MLWKVITFLLVGICIFVIGLWLGSVQAEWAKPENKDAVAYLAMVGGWVSGIATSIAVIISLYATYQSSQSNVESVKLLFERIPAINKEDIGINIVVKNVKPVTVHFQKMFIAVEGSKASADISKLQRGGNLIPYALYQLGEKWEFAFNTHYSPQWALVFSQLESGGEPNFKKGFFILESAMKQYRLKMPDEFLQELSKKHSVYLLEKIDNAREF